MARTNKFEYEALVESELISAPGGLSLDELLARCGLNVDRSTLFRHLARLIELGRVERVGNARASRYRPANIARAPALPEPPQAARPAAANVVRITERQPTHGTPHSMPGEAHQAQQTGRLEPENPPVSIPEHDIALKKAVRTVVRDWKRCNEMNLRIYLSLLVKPEYVEELAAAVKVELAGLHEGNLEAYGLTPLEFSRYIASESSRARSA